MALTIERLGGDPADGNTAGIGESPAQLAPESNGNPADDASGGWTGGVELARHDRLPDVSGAPRKTKV